MQIKAAQGLEWRRVQLTSHGEVYFTSACSVFLGCTANMKPLHLSRTVAYAVRATVQLARDRSPDPIPCSQLAADGNMPERFLLQILRNLVTHGILRSTRGVDGGYSLVRSADEVSLLDVIEAIEGPINADGNGAVSVDIRLNDALRKVAASTRQQLQAIKLSQLIEPRTVDD